MQQRKRNRARMESLLRETDKHGGVLSDRVQQYRPLKLGRNLTEDVDALSFKELEMAQALHALTLARQSPLCPWGFNRLTCALQHRPSDDRRNAPVADFQRGNRAYINTAEQQLFRVVTGSFGGS